MNLNTDLNISNLLKKIAKEWKYIILAFFLEVLSGLG